MRLVETDKIAKGKLVSSDTAQFFEIPVFGDRRNCSAISFALGMIDLIKRDQLTLDETQYRRFYEAIRAKLALLKELEKLYRHRVALVEGNVYHDLADPMRKIINWMQAFENENRLPTYQEFKQVISSATTRETIAATAIALGAAVRTLGAELYQEKLVELNDAEFNQDAIDIAQDGVAAGREIIEPLAHFFNVNITFYQQDENVRLKNIGAYNNPIPDAPSISLVHHDNHWNFLLPANQTNGLACLPMAITTVVNDVSANAVKLFSNVRNLFKSSEKRESTPNKWQTFVDIANQEKPKQEEYYDIDFSYSNHNDIIKLVKDNSFQHETVIDYSINADVVNGKSITQEKQDENTVHVTKDAQETLDEALAMKLQQEEADAEFARKLQQEASDEALARQLQAEEERSYRFR